MSPVPFHTSHRAGAEQGSCVDPGCCACAPEPGPRRYCPADRRRRGPGTGRCWSPCACYDMRSWAITKALVGLVPGLPDSSLRIRCPIHFPGGSAGEASELASLGPTAVTHPSNGVSWHCLARAGRKGSTCLGRQEVVAQQPPRFARGCPSTVGREGPPKMKERCM